MKHVGTVKSYRTRNGCGFISFDGEDVFVHVSNILLNEGDPADILVPGEQVEFEVFTGRRGKAAQRVKRLAPLVLPEQRGSIKRTFDRKGFGFIESGDGDVFFHYADVLFDHIVIGVEVRYLATRVNGRLRAFRVRRNRDG